MDWTSGYVAEIDAPMLAKYRPPGYEALTREEQQRTNPLGYEGGDTVGATGIEHAWESYLRGQRGWEKRVVDARGRYRSGPDAERLVDPPGKLDPIPGRDLRLSVDVELEQAIDKAMRPHAAGSVVAVDVRTGRLLALYSKPSFDPNDLSGGEGHARVREAFNRLYANPLRPVLDKTMSGAFQPGSTMKPFSALAALEDHMVDPEHTASPLPPSSIANLTPIVPAAWPRSCREDENECTIALRIDACGASVLLMGDAEHQEEALLDPRGPVTLLQVGHHGSDTSTSPALLSRIRPRYAVVSAGKPDEGLNRDYCHPRAIVVRRLSRVLGGASTATLTAFDGDRCDRATPADWVQVPASDRLWATERDGDVVLTTAGDGVFRRAGP